MLLFSRSIVEEIRTEKRQSTEPDFVALLPDAIITTAPDTVVYRNEGAESIFQYTPSESVGRTIRKLTVPANRVDDERRLREEKLRAGHTTYESLCCRKDGSPIYDLTSEYGRGSTFTLVVPKR